MSRYAPMNADYKAKWIKALRSGKYEQTTGVLRNEGGMCCLGVLCDIVAPKDWQIKSAEYSWEKDSFTMHGNEQFPPKDIQKGTGLTRPKCERLADMNDGTEADFKEIADFIEKNF